MRKIAILVGAAVLLTLSLAPAAFARNFQCTTYPCYGTNHGDFILERGGSVRDAIYGLRGDDNIDATLFGGDRDRLWGNRGDDNLNADDNDSRDTVSGGPGFDRCVGDPGDVLGVSCEIRVRS